MDVDAAIGSLLPILGDPDLGILPAVEVGGSAPSVGAGETKEKPRPSRKNDTAKGPTPASRANASEAGTSRPYLQQNPHTRQELQRKLEVREERRGDARRAFVAIDRYPNDSLPTSRV